MSNLFKGITTSISKALMTGAKEEVKEELKETPKTKKKKTPEEKKAYRLNKYDLTEEEYEAQRYDLLGGLSMKWLMTKPKIRAKVDYVAERYGAPRGEVYAKAIKLSNEHGITLNKFAREDLFALEGEELEAAITKIHGKRQRQYQTLSNITGMDIDEVKEYIEKMNEEYGVGVANIIDNELFKLSHDEIVELLEKNKRENELRKEKIKKANNWDDFEFERSVAYCRFRYFIYSLKIYDNLGCWAYPREVLDTFAVPRDRIDLCRTYNTASTKVLDNKIDFDIAFKDFLGRKFWVNKDTNIDEFRDFIDGQDRLFCKPINLCGGHGCYDYTVTDDVEAMYEYFMNEPLMIIEQIPKQHHLISEIYPHSIDTVRVTAVIKDDKFIPINSWIKFGANGSVVDGRASGGCFAGVDVKTGIVDTPAINYDNERFTNHMDTGKPITGFQIPYWPEVLDLAERALRHIDGINFVGWDICVTEDGPIIIEGNSGPALADVQLLYSYEGHEGEGQRWRYIDLLEDPDKWRRV